MARKAMPPEVRAVLRRHKEGRITKRQRDAELSRLASSTLEAVGLRTAKGVEHRMLSLRKRADD